ncbi:MAG: Ig-like domain-containing protein [Gemmatimonadetes bacterium]|nr:Ig-like domain-containing protein [Gemmatimonadota bacterium]
MPRGWIRATLVAASLMVAPWTTTCGGSPTATQPPDNKEPETVGRVIVSPDADTIFTGGAQQFSATVEDVDGNHLTGTSVTWSSSNPDVATVDATGLGTGVSEGEVTIVATSQGVSGQTALTVARMEEDNLSAGAVGACGLTTTGQAYCWGDNSWGQLGNGRNDPSNVPVAVSGGLTFQEIGAGHDHTCGLTNAGQVYCWGDNSQGQLGNGTNDPSDVPVAVSGGLKFQWISAGDSHTCGLTVSGRAYCWGNNWDGKLGNGGNDPSDVPVAVSGGLSFQWISAGLDHTCAITRTGQAYCWGWNGWGQLGSGGLDSAVPVPVSGGLSFQRISAGWTHTCALTNSGQAYCWGGEFPDRGELGNGTTEPSAVPVAVSGGLSFQDISAGLDHTCALTSSGQAHCWGSNYYGTLGNGTDDPLSDVPVAVSGGLTFERITAAADHDCALTGAGQVYCWGSNSDGQLGTGTNDASNVPVAVSGGLTFR